MKRHQNEYYHLLSAVGSDSKWEAWIALFLEGLAQPAGETERNIVEGASLVTADRRFCLLAAPKAGSAAHRLFETLPMIPLFTVERARRHLDTSFPTANVAIRLLTRVGVVTEMTGQRKNRSVGYQTYIELSTDVEAPEHGKTRSTSRLLTQG